MYCAVCQTQLEELQARVMSRLVYVTEATGLMSCGLEWFSGGIHKNTFASKSKVNVQGQELVVVRHHQMFG